MWPCGFCAPAACRCAVAACGGMSCRGCRYDAAVLFLYYAIRHNVRASLSVHCCLRIIVLSVAVAGCPRAVCLRPVLQPLPVVGVQELCCKNKKNSLNGKGLSQMFQYFQPLSWVSVSPWFSNMCPFALQKTTYCTLKGHLSEAKRWPFATH